MEKSLLLQRVTSMPLKEKNISRAPCRNVHPFAPSRNGVKSYLLRLIIKREKRGESKLPFLLLVMILAQNINASSLNISNDFYDLTGNTTDGIAPFQGQNITVIAGIDPGDNAKVLCVTTNENSLQFDQDTTDHCYANTQTNLNRCISVCNQTGFNLNVYCNANPGHCTVSEPTIAKTIGKRAGQGHAVSRYYRTCDFDGEQCSFKDQENEQAVTYTYFDYVASNCTRQDTLQLSNYTFHYNNFSNIIQTTNFTFCTTDINGNLQACDNTTDEDYTKEKNQTLPNPCKTTPNNQCTNSTTCWQNLTNPCTQNQTLYNTVCNTNHSYVIENLTYPKACGGITNPSSFITPINFSPQINCSKYCDLGIGTTLSLLKNNTQDLINPCYTNPFREPINSFDIADNWNNTNDASSSDATIFSNERLSVNPDGSNFFVSTTLLVSISQQYECIDDESNDVFDLCVGNLSTQIDCQTNDVFLSDFCETNPTKCLDISNPATYFFELKNNSIGQKNSTFRLYAGCGTNKASFSQNTYNRTSRRDFTFFYNVLNNRSVNCSSNQNFFSILGTNGLRYQGINLNNWASSNEGLRLGIPVNPIINNNFCDGGTFCTQQFVSANNTANITKQNVCTGNATITNTCFDGIQNINETETDYGGSCGQCLNNANKNDDVTYVMARQVFKNRAINKTECDNANATLGMGIIIVLIISLTLFMALFIVGIIILFPQFYLIKRYFKKKRR